MSISSLESWISDVHPLESFFQKLEEAQNVPDVVPLSEPIAGLDIRCGPVLRYAGCLENGTHNYRGSILLVLNDEKTESRPVITYTQGPLTPSSLSRLKNGQFPGKLFDQQAGHSFWRFDINLNLEEYEQKVRYSINDSITYEFFLPRFDQGMNIMSYSCNGFSLATITDPFKGSLWYDVLRAHYTKNRYHVMLGGGDQLYCDAVKNASQVFAHWLHEKNPIKKHSQKMTPEIEASFNDFYLNQYLKWFGKGFWVGANSKTLQSLYPIALACIPSVNIFDDHDIIDGFGSYHDSTMAIDIFSGIGNVAYKYYMLFQHQLSVKNDEEYLKDPSWILSNKPGPFIKERSHSVFAKLGSGIGFLGLDCRTERKLKQIVSDDTYDIVFQRLNSEVKKDPSIKHLLVLLGVPIAYPRLVWLEWLLSSPLLYPARTLAQKGIMAKGLVNEFDGSVEVLDDLNDHWCSKHHKKERNALIARLQGFGATNAIRITILSGDVHLAALGRFKTKLHHHLFTKKYDASNDKVKTRPEADPRLMLNVISSAIVNAPPPDAMATLLNKRSGIHHFDHNTDEDMVPLFTKDVDDSPRDNKEFLNKRNWSDIIPIGNVNTSQTLLSYETGTTRLPGPVTGPPNNLEIREERELEYKITENSLIATIHVEKDSKDLQSETADYEIIVPELVESFHLENIGVKD